MAEDRANNPARVPKLPSQEDIRHAQQRGKITDDEAKDLGGTNLPRGPFTKTLRKGSDVNRLTEEESARRVHRSAGLSQGDW